MYNMTNIINTAVCYICKLRVNPKSSHHKEKKFFSFYFVSMRLRMFTKPTVVIIS